MVPWRRASTCAKKFFAGLLAEDVAEKGAEGADVTAQRSFFQFSGLGFELGKALLPALGISEKSHRLLIMHDFSPLSVIKVPC